MSAIDLGGFTQPLQGAFDVIMVFYMDATKHFQAQPSNLHRWKCSGEFIFKLCNFLGLKSSNIHLIGHSLGAHIEGFAGDALKRKGRLIWRITELDPAGPLFTGIFDFAKPLGDIEFCINGGFAQPDCSLWNLPKNIWQYGWVGGFTNTYACKNMFAYVLMLEDTEDFSENCQLVGNQCTNYIAYRKGKCNENYKSQSIFYSLSLFTKKTQLNWILMKKVLISYFGYKLTFFFFFRLSYCRWKCSGEFIFKLCNFLGLSSSNIHLIGHSLGAHIEGFAGDALKRKGRLIWRITELDPAGPLFTGIFDFAKPLGDIEFCINGGFAQPDCSLWNLPKNIWQYGWVGGFTNTYACKNMFAYVLMLEDTEDFSENCQLVGNQCTNYIAYRKGKCADCGNDGKACAVISLFGENDRNSGQGYLKPQSGLQPKKVYLNTLSKPPYCAHKYAIEIELAEGSEQPGGKFESTLEGKYFDSARVFVINKDFLFEKGDRKFSCLVQHDKNLIRVSVIRATIRLYHDIWDLAVRSIKNHHKSSEY
uniref:Lipase domain-containing protein n=1 Tax=Tetranychus urticae TaxID=32264 RepID=T1L333_TETUR